MRYLGVLLAITLFLIPGRVSSQVLQYPATGVWNGFNEHVNVIECGNAGESSVGIHLSVRDNSADEIGSSDFYVAAKGTAHIILNSFGGIEDAYGTYVLTVTSGDGSTLSCLTAFYRMAASGSPKAIEYGFVIPVLNSLSGISAGIYNSMNPAFGALPVFNWLSVYNPGESSFSAQVNVYNQLGTLDAARSFAIENLAPSERRDFALGHEQGQVVGLYQIVPQDTSASYAAFLTRFSQG